MADEPTFRGQLGVGVRTTGGETQFHPCATDSEAWDLYSVLTATMPGATVWVGVQRSD